MRSERLIHVGYLFAVILLVGIGFYCQRAVVRVQEATELRAVNRQRLLEAERMLSFLKDMETSQRGFVLTGRDKYLRLYKLSAPSLLTKLQHLEASFADQPELLSRMSRVKTLALAKQQEMEEAIRLRKEKGFAASLALMQTDRGKTFMDEIRVVIGEISQSSQSKIDHQSVYVLDVVNQSKWVVGAGTALATLLYGLALILVERNRRRKEWAESQTKNANARLESQRKQLEAVVQVQTAVATAGLNSGNVLNIILIHTQRMTQAEGAVLEFLEGEHMVYRAVSGEADRFLGMKVKRDGSLSGTAVREGTVLVCANTETDERVDREACRRVNIGSMMVVPLRQGELVTGVLKVFSRETNRFSEEQARSLELIAGVLSSAYQHALAYEEKNSLVNALEETKRELTAARDKADMGTRAKSDFLANMSHEIRTPLNGILGMVGILQDSPLNTEQLECAQTIERSGKSLLGLLNDILDFSKIEAGKLDFEEVDFDIVSTVQDLQKTFQFAAQQKHLELITTIEQNFPLYLRGDPGRLRQVLMNLLGNAIKFTEKGFISLSARTVRLVGDYARLRFEVKDTGTGIPREVVGRLFQAFTQADSSTTRKYGGTGLGLSISKRLVEAMKGEIGLTSEFGRGSTFWFEVELRVGQSQAREQFIAEREEAEFKMARPLRVLLVEDNQVNQKIAVKMLEKIGVRVETAFNGEEALLALRDRHFDMILMDCQMPVMDGYEATSRIRSEPALKNLPVIAMTANAMKGDEEKCLRAGMDDYLPKPISAKRLAAVMRKWVEKIESDSLGKSA